jgi:hypothetical protein
LEADGQVQAARADDGGGGLGDGVEMKETLMRIAIVFMLLAGCACAKKPKVVTPPPIVVVPIEKVSDSDLARYKSLYYSFKALEYEILEKHRIDPESGEVFDPDTGLITRPKKRGGR